MAHPLSHLYLHCFQRISVLFLFVITAAGVMPCGGPKMSPRTSSIVQIIFSFWSCEASDGILGLHVAKSKGSLKRLKY